MKVARHAVWSLVLLLLAGSGCADYDPENPPIIDCVPAITDHPELSEVEVESVPAWPTRILFVFDGSHSMAFSDPAPCGRVRAIREILQDLESNPECEIGLIVFGGQATGLSTGDDPAMLFTRDQSLLSQALEALVEFRGNTNYESALLMAELAIESRLQSESQQSLSTSSYHVVFLSDGLPCPADYDAGFNTDDSISELVDRIVRLGEEYGAGDLKMHFAHLAAGAPDYAEEELSDLLLHLADLGNGQYLYFPTGNDIDFSSIGFF